MAKQHRIFWRCICIFVFALLMEGGLPARAAEAALLHQTEAVIYGLDSSYSTISIPEDGQHPQSFQITVEGEGNPTYRVLSRYEAGLEGCTDYDQEAVNVSEDGLVTVGSTIWYNGGGYWTTMKIEGAQARVENNYGTAVIRVTVGTDHQDLKVRVLDYADEYYQNALDAYIADHITSDMTELEKIVEITKYPASFDYSASYSSGKSMVLNGGGDCWASTGLIIALSDKLGLKAWARNGNRDAGAGSGHRNALVESASGDLWYECEAGYGMAKNSQTGLRPYDVEERTSLYCYYTTADSTVSVYQYDGYDTDVTTLRIPASIDGKTVTGIGAKFLYGDSHYTEVVLPDTITSIGEDAFFYCRELQKLEIPASVTDLTGNPFAACSKLTELTLDPDNSSYLMEDGILYSADRKTLIAYPSGKTETSFTVPYGVETISASAFHVNENLVQVDLPDTVKQIGEDAFYSAGSLKEIRLSNALETIGDGAFYRANQLERLVVPQTVSSVGQFAFYGNLPALYVLSEQASYGENVVASSTAVYCEENASIVSSLGEGVTPTLCEKEELSSLAAAANTLTDLEEETTTEQVTEESTTTEQAAEERATTEQATEAEAGTEQRTEEGVTTGQATEAEAGTEQRTEEGVTTGQATATEMTTEQRTEAGSTTEQAVGEGITTEQRPGTGTAAVQEIEIVPSTERNTQEVPVTEQGTGTAPSTEGNTQGSPAWEQEPGTVPSTERNTRETPASEREPGTVSTTERNTQEVPAAERGTEALPTTEHAAQEASAAEQNVEAAVTTEQNADVWKVPEKDTDSLKMPSKVTGLKAKAKKKQLVLKWTRVKDITGYEIQVSLKKNYKQPKIFRVKASKKSYCVNKLKSGKKYYVRIRAYKSYSSAGSGMDVYGKWSTLKAKTGK